MDIRSGRRYYAFIIVFLQQLFTVQMFLFFQQKRAIRSALLILSFFLCLSIVDGAYFSVKAALDFKKTKLLVRKNDDFFYHYFKAFIVQNPNVDICVSSSDDYFPNLASAFSKKGVFDIHTLKTSMPAVRQETYLFTIFLDWELSEYANYIKNSDVRFYKKIDEYNYFLQHIKPIKK